MALHSFARSSQGVDSLAFEDLGMKRVLVGLVVGIAALVSMEGRAIAASEGGARLGGSTYFAWRITNPSGSSTKVIGYGCQIRDQIAGVSRMASVERYEIKRSKGSDEWWIESIGGLVVKPGEEGFQAVRVKASGRSDASSLVQVLQDRETGWLRNDSQVNALGKACVNGGLGSAVKVINQLHDLSVSLPK